MALLTDTNKGVGVKSVWRCTAQPRTATPNGLGNVQRNGEQPILNVIVPIGQPGDRQILKSIGKPIFVRTTNEWKKIPRRHEHGVENGPRPNKAVLRIVLHDTFVVVRNRTESGLRSCSAIRVRIAAGLVGKSITSHLLPKAEMERGRISPAHVDHATRRSMMAVSYNC